MRIAIYSLIGLAASAACAPAGPYLWMDDYRSAAEPAGKEAYVIETGDLIAVRVYNQEAMSARERVRPDGKISLPFLHDVQAAGLAPDALAALLQVRLKDFINVPVVNVMIEETRPLIVPVLGEVGKPGQYTLEKGAGVLDALAAAGGLSEFAHRDRIFVLRRPASLRLRTTFAALSRGDGSAARFRMQPGDTVVVE